jgi:hypothetical protein
MPSQLRVGWLLVGLAVTLLATAIGGIAPWVFGTDADCSEQGPHSFFLLCWLASAGVAIGAVVRFGTAVGATLTRRAGIALASLVTLGAVALYVVVVGDGIQECGF